jgi:hypothetical protein
MFAFGIHGVEDVEPCTVIGRCYKGPLRVGGVFTLFEEEGGTAHVVRLEVLQIEAYQRELDEIDEGLTARLTLHGSGGQLVKERGILHGVWSREQSKT